MEIVKSPYLDQFMNLRMLIQKEAVQSEDNLNILKCLEDPCHELADSDPLNIPKILPKLLNCVRVIWNLSSHFGVPERIIGLLRKISNEIIIRCKTHVNIEAIFEGEVLEGINMLKQCISASESWKFLYRYY